MLRQLKEEPNLAKNRVIVVCGKGYHQGVVGIVASRICERYAKPAVIIGIDEKNQARGSARSIEGFNIFEAISACSDILVHFGGHPGAAGMSLCGDKTDAFRTRINAYAAEKNPVLPAQEGSVGFKISPFFLNVVLA